MKRSYESMEAYKVSFNANEQIAAACDVFDTGSKYDLGQIVACVVSQNQYGSGQSCFANDGQIQKLIKYAN